jgi:hypothetical protein
MEKCGKMVGLVRNICDLAMDDGFDRKNGDLPMEHAEKLWC